MPYKNPDDRREYQRKWIAKRRADYFKDKHCATCNSTERLELDHKDPREKLSHKIWSWCEARRLAEIAKCQILCHWCHQAKSIEDTKKMREHGTIDSYVRFHCRCDKCLGIKHLVPEELRRYEDYSGNPNEETTTPDSEEPEWETDGKLRSEAFEQAFA